MFANIPRVCKNELKTFAFVAKVVFQHSSFYLRLTSESAMTCLKKLPRCRQKSRKKENTNRTKNKQNNPYAANPYGKTESFFMHLCAYRSRVSTSNFAQLFDWVCTLYWQIFFANSIILFRNESIQREFPFEFPLCPPNEISSGKSALAYSTFSTTFSYLIFFPVRSINLLWQIETRFLFLVNFLLSL